MSLSGTPEQLEFIRRFGARRIYIVSCAPFDFSIPSQVGINISSEPYDDATFNIYEPRLKGSLSFEQSLNDTYIGGASFSGGVVEVDNSDDQITEWMDYAWSGARCEIWAVDPTNDSWNGPSDYHRIFFGFCESCDWANDSTLEIRFNQYGSVLNVDVFPQYDGQPALRVPRSHGQVRGVELELKDQTLLKYDRGWPDQHPPDAVYINGTPQNFDADYATEALLDQPANDPPAGTYSTCNAEGLIRIGSAPISGPITLDGGGATQATLETTAKQLALQVGNPNPLLPPPDRGPDLPFGTLFQNGEPLQRLGLHIDGAMNVNDALTMIFSSVGAAWYYNNTGFVEAELFDVPKNPIGDIDLSSEGIGDPVIRKAPPAWRIELNYRRNHTILSNVATSIPEDRQKELGREWPTPPATADDGQRLNFYQSATVIRRDTLLDDVGEANAEAARQLALFSPDRFIWECRVWGRPGAWALNDTWTVYHDRRAAGGIDMVVIGINDYLLQGFTDLRLWG